MARRHVHYERAFEAYLRARRIPYIAVDEARRTLLPDSRSIRFLNDGDDPAVGGGRGGLKSFDFVVYGEGMNLLVDIKGRRVPMTRSGACSSRLESWVTEDDVESLARWEALFNGGAPAGHAAGGYEGVFVFIYACEQQPPDALFQEVFEHGGRGEGGWYVLRCVTLADYRGAMKRRSPRWRTVDLPARAFERLSEPFAPGRGAGGGAGLPGWRAIAPGEAPVLAAY
jgi:hypothetical protein